jgi:rod shape-determining protein MreC
VFNFRNKSLVYPVLALGILLLILSLIPSLRNPFLNTLKIPVSLLRLIRRETGAIIFYHRNFMENELLQKQINSLKAKINSQEELYKENIRLKNMLSFKQASAYKLIAARVIARSPDSWSSNMIIDKGKNSGIKPGMPAITNLGLVGRIVETTNFTSKVLLINDPNLSVSCMVKRSRQEGLVSGTLGRNLVMHYLPEDADIKIQDTIITSGLNQTYPKGLLIGVVVDIGKEFSGLAQYAIVRPAVNLSNIEEILVIIQ